ncbi:MAG: DUF6105 family protein [Rhizobiaceae bacterium]
MRIILILWAAPVGLFWGWYFLSLNDLSFGCFILSRKVHDFVFDIYGQILGVDPAEIPGFVARACMFDAVLLTALYAFRRRRQIAAWWRRRRGAPIAKNIAAPGE